MGHQLPPLSPNFPWSQLSLPQSSQQPPQNAFSSAYPVSHSNPGIMPFPYAGPSSFAPQANSGTDSRRSRRASSATMAPPPAPVPDGADQGEAEPASAEEKRRRNTAASGASTKSSLYGLSHPNASSK